MDIYLTALAIGGVGLAGMAVGGFAHHGSHGDAGTGGHDFHSGHDISAAHASGSVAHGHAGHGQAPHAHAAHGHPDPGHVDHLQGDKSAGTATNPLLALMSPFKLFSLALGLGAAGLLFRPVLGEPLLFAAALATGIAFERLIVRPIWNLIFRFESAPAATLESVVMDVATAVTAFDRNGQGLIAVDVDGQMVQLLGTLQKSDQEMKVRIPVGSRLRIEHVDAARNRCTVSLI